MTEQEWLDNVAARLPERDLQWVLDLARICSTQWTGDKPPTGAVGDISWSPGPSAHAPLAHTDPAEESGPERGVSQQETPGQRAAAMHPRPG